MERPEIRSVRRAVTALFFVNGTATASWFVRIPAVKAEIGVSAGELSIALLCVAVGSIATMLVASRMVERFGAGAVMISGAALLCLGLALIGFAPSLLMLSLAGLVLGSGNGLMNVSLNARASEIEREYGRPIMPSFHAWLSLGGFASAAVGGLIAAAEVGPGVHLPLTALALLAFSAISVPVLLGDAAVQRSEREIPEDSEEVEEGSGRRFRLPSGKVLVLGVIGFCVLFGEGAMADWSAVYLHDLGTTEAFAAAGFAIFSLAMAAGRVFGNVLTRAFGPTTLVRFGGLLGATGLGVGLVGGTPALALVGFGLVGLGFSTVFPLTLSAAGEAGRVSSSAIAFVSACGYSGLLLGPTTIGLLAEISDLRFALGSVLVLALFVTVAGKAVTDSKRRIRVFGTEGILLAYGHYAEIRSRLLWTRISLLAHLSGERFFKRYV